MYEVTFIDFAGTETTVRMSEETLFETMFTEYNDVTNIIELTMEVAS